MSRIRSYPILVMVFLLLSIVHLAAYEHTNAMLKRLVFEDIGIDLGMHTSKYQNCSKSHGSLFRLKINRVGTYSHKYLLYSIALRCGINPNTPTHLYVYLIYSNIQFQQYRISFLLSTIDRCRNTSFMSTIYKLTISNFYKEKNAGW